MKPIAFSGIAAIALTAFSAPAFAADAAAAFTQDIGSSFAVADEFDRRGRGRGGRSKPRIPGGSGCDDPEDILEHPECRG